MAADRHRAAPAARQAAEGERRQQRAGQGVKQVATATAAAPVTSRAAGSAGRAAVVNASRAVGGAHAALAEHGMIELALLDGIASR